MPKKAKTTFIPPDTRAEFSRLLMSRGFLSQSYASELAGGLKKPARDMEVEIERVLGIPRAFWDNWKGYEPKRGRKCLRYKPS